MTNPVQTAALPPDYEYFLDMAAENHDLDSGARMALIIWGDRGRIASIIEAVPVSRGNRLSVAAMAAYANELILGLEPDYRLGAYLFATSHLFFSMRSTAEFFSYAAIQDSCEGGCLKPWSKAKLNGWGRRKQDSGAYPRARRKLHSGRWVDRFVKLQKESGQLRGLWHIIRDRAVPEYSDAGAYRARAIFTEAYAEHRATLAERNRRGMARLLAATSGERGVDRRKRHKAARRAANAASGIVGADTVSAFAAGKPVFLEGQNAVLEVSRATSIHRSGVGALDIAVLDKGRVKLADLCLYIDGTPALDQLAALALGISAGEESEIIATANVIHLTGAGEHHPVLEGRAVHRLEAARNVDPAFYSSQDRRRARDEAYWQESKPIWMGALGRYVFHRDWKYFSGAEAASGR